MKNNETQQQTILSCARCSVSFPLPDKLTDLVKAQAAGFVRNERVMLAIQNLRENVYLDLPTCKGVALHITKEKNTCHRCGAELEHQKISTCQRCNCLNLNW